MNIELEKYIGFIDAWMIQVFLIILFFATANFIQKRALQKLHTQFIKTARPWDDAIVEALKRPLTALLWVIGISMAMDIISAETQAAIFDYVDPLRRIGIIFCLIWFAIRLVYGVENSYIEIKKVSESTDLTSIHAIGKLIRLALIITGGLIMLQTLGISVSGVLAFGGIGGIAVGFAAKDLLANFFGGLMIYLDRPFEVGNWIRSPDKDIEGVVEDIGWRLTRIRTFQRRPLYVPNAVFANIVVENPSRMSHRRIKETIGIRYDDISGLPNIVQAVKDMLNTHQDIDHDQVIIVNFDNFGASSLDFFIYAYTKTTDWVKYHEVKQDVLLKVSEIVESHHAEIAFPTTTLHVANELLVADRS